MTLSLCQGHNPKGHTISMQHAEVCHNKGLYKWKS